MLQNISIDGFRSLVGFDIELTPGLQVLVGPNGSGKSNFVEFLDFLGELLATDLDSAISVAEGAGSIFSRERHTRDNAHLKFSISGENTQRFSDETEAGPKPKVGYRYDVHVRYDKRIPAIYVSRESLCVTVAGNLPFRINRHTNYVGGQYNTKVTINSRSHDLYDVIYANSLRYRPTQEKDVSLEDILQDGLSPSSTVLRRFFYHESVFDAVWNDLTSFRSINLEPTSARLPSPVSRESGIQRTGENLALALYKMARGEYYGKDYFWAAHLDRRLAQKTAFNSIINWCREINSDIVTVESELDLAEAVLKPQITFSFSEKPFAFGRISDGTVKWVALVTMMFAEQQFSVIEEPENFLHPKMQEGMISLSREVLARKSTNAQFIMSTHSQTILDMCHPCEIIIFGVENGLTRARRPSNIEQLNLLLEESDFGVGHLYKIGILRG
ncbi:AAA family ATPase [Brevundimonas sp. Leaf363]|uniref:AAA family ATPase n=1 Tax=Brevundimonas sp. Leaf363 TaxID=1736353 RepID=UPI0009E72D37|nr:AAA family ATPase [Brevundimonas sp. Leaf363]